MSNSHLTKVQRFYIRNNGIEIANIVGILDQYIKYAYEGKEPKRFIKKRIRKLRYDCCCQLLNYFSNFKSEYFEISMKETCFSFLSITINCPHWSFGAVQPSRSILFPWPELRFRRPLLREVRSWTRPFGRDSKPKRRFRRPTLGSRATPDEARRWSTTKFLWKNDKMLSIGHSCRIHQFETISSILFSLLCKIAYQMWYR